MTVFAWSAGQADAVTAVAAAQDDGVLFLLVFLPA